jgi:hypothetical protein
MWAYQGESWMLDSPEGVCAGHVGFEYPATSVLFSKTCLLVLRWAIAVAIGGDLVFSS